MIQDIVTIEDEHRIQKCSPIPASEKKAPNRYCLEREVSEEIELFFYFDSTFPQKMMNC